MYQFIKKILLIGIPIFLSYLTLIFLFPQFIKPNLKCKILDWDELSLADIIICGDSRADRQLDPKIIKLRTNKNCINVAESSMDLYSLSKRLSSLNVQNKTFIISASFWQINDAAIETGYFRQEAFSDLTISEKVCLYKFSPIDLLKMQNREFTSLSHTNLSFGDTSRHINSGFNRIECRPYVVNNSLLTRHEWYKRIEINGIKRKLLLAALLKISNMKNNTFIIYNAPVSPAFKNLSHQNGIWEAEQAYCAFITQTIKERRLDNIFFYNLTDLSYNPNYFYDSQHFCSIGAEKFTNDITSIFKL